MDVYVSLSGRLGRRAYFGYSILLAVAVAVIFGLAFLFAGAASRATAPVIILLAVGGLLAAWGGICLAVKRLHDLDLSGWNYLWMLLVPAVVSVSGQAAHALALLVIAGLMQLAVTAYLLFWPGTEGANSFGYPP